MKKIILIGILFITAFVTILAVSHSIDTTHKIKFESNRQLSLDELTELELLSNFKEVKSITVYDNIVSVESDITLVKTSTDEYELKLLNVNKTVESEYIYNN